MLENEWRRVQENAARLEVERQAALLATEEMASMAESQKKGKEQLVGILILDVNFRTLLVFFACSICFSSVTSRESYSSAWLV